MKYLLPAVLLLMILSACGEDKVPNEGAIRAAQRAALKEDLSHLSKAEQLDLLFSEAAETDGFMGHVVATKDGDVFFAMGYGEADIAENIPHGMDVPFPIGATTQQWASALVFLMAEDGIVDLDIPINRYLGATCPMPQGTTTLRQLMAHTSGLVRDDHFERILRDKSVLFGPAKPIANVICSLPRSDEPGTEYHYKATDTMVLQAVVEEVTGEPFALLLRDYLLEPLGMDNSGMMPPGERPDGMMTGYERIGADYAPEAFPYYATAARGGVSTPRDMIVWNNAIIEAPLFDSIRDRWLRGDGTIGYAGAGNWVYPYSTGEGVWLAAINRHALGGAIHTGSIIRPKDHYAFTLVTNVGGLEAQKIYDDGGLAYETIRILLSDSAETPDEG